MIVLVTGGRNYADREKLFATLDALQPISILIHGAAAGADRLAGEWCLLRGVTCHEVHANWTAYGKSWADAERQDGADRAVSSRARRDVRRVSGWRRHR